MLPIAIVGFLLGAAGVSAGRLSLLKPATLSQPVPLDDHCDPRYNAFGNPHLGIESADGGWGPACASNDTVTEVFSINMVVFDASRTAMLVVCGDIALEFAPQTAPNGSTSAVTVLVRGERTEVAKVNLADASDDTVEVTTPLRLPAVLLVPFFMSHRPLGSRSTTLGH